MEQPELGNHEEDSTRSSSAELPESETAATSDEPMAQNASADVGDLRTDVDDAEADSSMNADEEGTATATAANAETDNSTDESSDAGADDEDVIPDADEDDGTDGDEETADDSGPLKRGQVLLGTITSTNPNEIVVDLGEGRTGIVPKREVELLTGTALDGIEEGAELHVYIVNPNNHRGQTILSITHAQEELDWRKAEEYMESKQVYDGRIGGYNKGGLIVRFGRLRGFVPQSQISDKRMLDVDGETPEERFSDLVNQPISIKVMEVDRARNRLILSERAAMREVRKRRKETLIEEIEVGEIRDGRVVSLESFGAFVDIGGAEGLVHITELSWEHVTHPRQVLDVGQSVRVKIISVDARRNRIGLSIKQLKADPWDELATSFERGSLIRGEVTKLTKFGAFAKVRGLEAVEGLIHISELSDERVEHPRDVVNRGDQLTLRIVKIDVKERRLGLSLRQVNSAEFLDKDLERAYKEQAEVDQAAAAAATDDGVEAATAVDEAEAEAPAGAVTDETATEMTEAPAEEAETVAEAAAEDVEAAPVAEVEETAFEEVETVAEQTPLPDAAEEAVEEAAEASAEEAVEEAAEASAEEAVEEAAEASAEEVVEEAAEASAEEVVEEAPTEAESTPPTDETTDTPTEDDIVAAEETNEPTTDALAESAEQSDTLQEARSNGTPESVDAEPVETTEDSEDDDSLPR